LSHRQRAPGDLRARESFELLRDLIEARVDFAKPVVGAGNVAKSLLASGIEKLLSARGFTKLLTSTSSLALIIAVPFPTGMIVALAAVPLAIAAVLVAVRAAFLSNRRRADVDAIATVPVRVARTLEKPIAVAQAFSVFLSIVLARLLPPLILGLAIEIGGPYRLAVFIIVRLDDAVEPFADGHAGSSRGFARSLARLPAEASQIPRTARFHSRAQTTSGGAACALSRAGAR
jgi:hypothetical protein